MFFRRAREFECEKCSVLEDGEKNADKLNRDPERCFGCRLKEILKGKR